MMGCYLPMCIFFQVQKGRYKMKKRLLCIVLTLSLFVSMLPVASASAVDDFSPEEDIIIDNCIYAPTDETEFNHTPFEPITEADIPNEPVTCAVTPVYKNVASLGEDEVQVIMDAIINDVEVRAVQYSGEYCYKFGSGSNAFYVTCAAFHTAKKVFASESLSATVTKALNANDSSYKYTTLMRSYEYSWNGMSILRWSFVRIGVRAFTAKNNSEVVLSVKVDESFDVDAYDYILRDRVKCSLKVTPDMTARITNTGTKSLYFDSYEFRGVGENISSSVDMSKIVQLGYQTTKAVGALAGGLTTSTLYGAYQAALSLVKASSGSRKSYSTDLYPLSNSGKYPYMFTTPTPFAVKLAEDYATMELGLLGDRTSTTKFSVALTWTAS